jgi:uncharacterized protein
LNRTKEQLSRRLLTAATLALLVVIALPIAGWIAPGESLSALLRGEAVYWAATCAIVLYVLFVERRPLASIGLSKPSWRSVVFGLLAAAAALLGAIFIYVVVLPAIGQQPNQAQLEKIQRMPVWFECMLLLRAPIFEEIFYRGFAISRLTEILRSRWLAAAISLAAFTLAHLSYWGWSALIPVAYEGAVLTALYLWRGDLVANMIAHFTTDFVSFVAF